MYDLPSYVWALVLTGVIGIPALSCAVLYYGALAAGAGRRAATALTVTAAAVLGGWIVVSALLARSGVYLQDPGRLYPDRAAVGHRDPTRLPSPRRAGHPRTPRPATHLAGRGGAVPDSDGTGSLAGSLRVARGPRRHGHRAERAL